MRSRIVIQSPGNTIGSRFLSGQRINNSFSQGPSKQDKTEKEDQQSSVLQMCDANPNKYVFGVTVDRGEEQTLTRTRKGMTRANVPQNTLALDSGASVHFFSNENLMEKCYELGRASTIHCGGISSSYSTVGILNKELKKLPLPQGPVYVTKNGIANLVSLSELAKDYRIVMDTKIENAFFVFNDDDSFIKFHCRKNGLYCMDVEEGPVHTNYLTTVEDEKKHFSGLDVKKATLARYIQDCLCLPSDRDFADNIETGGIKECGIDRRHINVANEIFGPNEHALYGKTVQRPNKMPRDSSSINISPTILRRYGEVTLGMDVLHINGMPFLFSTAKHLKFMQCLRLRNKTTSMFLSTINKMKSVYEARGFKIKKIYADRAFDPCREKLAEMHIELICCDKNAHVHFVERGIRFIKERVRCIRSMLPKRIKKVPKKLMIEIVYATTKLVNSIRRKGGVHPVMSPRQIVTGRRLVIPPFPPGAFVYAVPGASISSVDKSRTLTHYI